MAEETKTAEKAPEKEPVETKPVGAKPAEKAVVVEPELSPIEKDRRAVAKGEMYDDHFEDKWGVKP